MESSWTHENGKVLVEETHKERKAAFGEYAKACIEFERCEGEGLLFVNQIRGGAIPKEYIPAVEQGLIEATKNCALDGYPASGLKATLVDGQYHPIDSSERAFKAVALKAFNSYLERIS